MVIVENDKEILRVLEIIFKDAGFLVTGFQSEKGVMETILNESPDVIVLDVIQPTINGTELCRAIKAREELKDVPIVALSTHFESHKIHSICADSVLGKPFNVDELLAVVESQVNA